MYQPSNHEFDFEDELGAVGITTAPIRTGEVRPVPPFTLLRTLPLPPIAYRKVQDGEGRTWWRDRAGNIVDPETRRIAMRASNVTAISGSTSVARPVATATRTTTATTTPSQPATIQRITAPTLRAGRVVSATEAARQREAIATDPALARLSAEATERRQQWEATHEPTRAVPASAASVAAQLAMGIPVAEHIRQQFAPRLGNIERMLRHAEHQRTATSEHRSIMEQRDYRGYVRGKLAEISARLPPNHPVQARLARIVRFTMGPSFM
jgi:hypothetical protein